MGENVQKGHKFAAQVEEYIEKGRLEEAMNANFLASKAYLDAVSDTRDAEAIKTLKLLYTNHLRQGRDLQRRIEQGTSATDNREYNRQATPPLISREEQRPTLSDESRIGKSYFVVDQDTHDNNVFDSFWDTIDNPNRSSRAAPAHIINKQSAELQLSYMVIPKTESRERRTSVSKTAEELQIENEHLKETVDLLTRQLATFQDIVAENEQLRRRVHELESKLL